MTHIIQFAGSSKFTPKSRKKTPARGKKRAKTINRMFEPDSDDLPPGLSYQEPIPGGTQPPKKLHVISTTDVPPEAQDFGCHGGLADKGFLLYEHPDFSTAWGGTIYIAASTSAGPPAYKPIFLRPGRDVYVTGYQEALQFICFIREPKGTLHLLVFVAPEFRETTVSSGSDNWTYNWPTCLKIVKASYFDWERIADAVCSDTDEESTRKHNDTLEMLRTAIEETNGETPRGMKTGTEYLRLTFTMPKSSIAHPSEYKRVSHKPARVYTGDTAPPLIIKKQPAGKRKTAQMQSSSSTAASHPLSKKSAVKSKLLFMCCSNFNIVDLCTCSASGCIQLYQCSRERSWPHSSAKCSVTPGAYYSSTNAGFARYHGECCS